MILLRQNNFSEESNKNDKAAKVGKEIGMAGGALGVGALGGLGLHGLAKRSRKLINRVNGKIFFKPADTKGARVARWKDGTKAMKIEEALKKGGEKITEFARTKGGKRAIIGGTTAALGGAAYLEAKKKDKKK